MITILKKSVGFGISQKRGRKQTFAKAYSQETEEKVKSKKERVETGR